MEKSVRPTPEQTQAPHERLPEHGGSQNGFLRPHRPGTPRSGSQVVAASASGFVTVAPWG